MDVLVYSNIKDVYKNTDTLLAKKLLTNSNVTPEQIRYALRLDYIHVGNLLVEVYGLNKDILSKCTTYYDLCNDSNAVGETLKVNELYSAIEQDVNIHLDALDILQNNKNVALGYLQQSVFLEQVCSTKATLKALISDQDYCNVVQATINNHSDTIVKTLSDVTPTTRSIGSGAGTWTYGVGEANIMIAYSCYDDYDTDYSIYHGNGAYRTAYVQRHSGNTNLANIICLRGIKLVGSGSSVGNVSYKHYTL